MKKSAQSSPLRLLLVLEWTLLSIVAIAQIITTIFNRDSSTLVPNILGLGVLLVMGRWLPQRRDASCKESLHKLLFLSFEFVLILGMVFLSHIPLFQLLFIVLVIRNCLLLEGRSRFAVTGIVFIAATCCQAYRLLTQALVFKIPSDQIGTYWVGFFLMFGLILLFLQLLVDAILSEHKSREELIAAHTRLRDYALKVEELATAQERNRIAREIHDALGHSLTGFNLYLEAALKLLHSEPTEAEDLIVEAKQLGAVALKEVRQSVSTLRFDPLEGRSLEVSIAALIEDFQRSTGISPTLNMAIAKPIPNEIKTAIYRITQEALTNISKYAAATAVEISLQSSVELELIVRDNGRGFDLHQNITGFGLQGMRERAFALRGNFDIVTALGSGCQIMARFPLEI